MQKIKNLVLLLLAAMIVVTGSVFAVLAEGESSTVTEETSDPGTESTETSAPDDPSTYYTIKLSASPSGSVLCYFNGSADNASEFKGTEETNLPIRLTAAEGYKLISVRIGVLEFEVVDGVCEMSPKFFLGESYTISAKTEALPPPAEKCTLTVSSKGIEGITVNGQPYADAMEFDSGSEVTVAFGDPAMFSDSLAKLTVNGAPASMTSGNAYTFVITGNTDVVMKYNVVTLSFAVSGPGTVSVDGVEFSVDQAEGSVSKTFDFVTGQSVTFTVSPASNYKLGTVGIDGAGFTTSGNTYSFENLDEDTSVNLTFEYAGGSIVETKYNITVNVGANGAVTIDGVTVTGTRTITKTAGQSVVFNIFPDTGYELTSFRVGGAEQTVSNGTYVLSAIGSDQTVAITFGEIVAPPIVTDQPIGIADINWNAARIIIDITNQTKIKPEVFERIATLTSSGDTEYVMFRGNNCIWYVPYGGRVTGYSAEYGDLDVTAVTSGATYDKITSAFAQNTEADLKFAIFAYEKGLQFPGGTLACFNVGSDFSGKFMMYLLFDAGNNSFSTKDSASDAVLVGTNGWTGTYAYDNEKNIVLTQDIDDSYTITAGAGAGGLINPSGSNSINAGADSSYTATANPGFVIKQILVDGLPIAEAVGQTQYTYTFSKVETNHTIIVEFMTADGGNVGGADDGGNATLIVTLVIIFVAVAGAAALFVVKWRQEKF